MGSGRCGCRSSNLQPRLGLQPVGPGDGFLRHELDTLYYTVDSELRHEPSPHIMTKSSKAKKAAKASANTGSRRARASSDSSATQQPIAKKQKGQALETVTDEESDSSAADVNNEVEDEEEDEDEQLGD